jgi:hypothetical protein
MSRTVVIQAAHYVENEAALMRDPLIQQMAGELLAANSRAQVTHADAPDETTHDFMLAALREYTNRGGKLAEHIGGPSNACMKVIDQALPAYEAMASDPEQVTYDKVTSELAQDVLRRWAKLRA